MFQYSTHKKAFRILINYTRNYGHYILTVKNWVVLYPFDFS